MTDEPKDHAPASTGPSRRDLLESALGAGAAVWAAGIAVPTGMYLWPAAASGPTKKYIEVDPASMPPGTGRVVSEGGKPVLLLRQKNGEFRALSAVCTHLGCIVHWNADQQQIQCPCHAGTFTPEGAVVSGPPPRPLASYPTQMVAGKLRITI